MQPGLHKFKYATDDTSAQKMQPALHMSGKINFISDFSIKISHVILRKQHKTCWENVHAF